MKRLSIITNLALSLFLSACDKNDNADSNGNSSGSSQNDGARQEEIANKIMDSMGEFAKAVSAVSDTKTAKSAATTINEIGDQFLNMAKELEALEVATQEMRESIHQKMAAREAEIERSGEREVREIRSILESGGSENYGKSVSGFLRSNGAGGKGI